MTIAITLLGRDFQVAPYKIGAMRKAAPIIERINATAGALSSFQGALEAARDLIELVAIGLTRIDASLTADALEDQLGLEDMAQLQQAALAILAGSGLAQGEATAPSAPAPQGA